VKQIKTGIIGTGYGAKKRALALLNDPRSRSGAARSHLITASGSNLDRTETFCQEFSITPSQSWLELVNNPDLDLIFICTINQLHYPVALEALKAGKNVVVEYPLALTPTEAKELINLAHHQQKLLHVEHIELLGGVHQAIANNIDQLGKIFYARYVTVMPQDPAPRNWKYDYKSFGYPLVGALSRIQRLTALFGKVNQVKGKTRYWEAPEEGYFSGCLSNAQLHFNNNLIADVIYGKGEIFSQRERIFELYGEQGKMIFEDEKGLLIKKDQQTEINVASRRGLFEKDTSLVLDYLTEGKPLYIKPEYSYYALKIAYLASHPSCQNN